MSVAIQSHTEVESNKDAYDAEFEGDATVDPNDDEDSLGPSQLCVDKATSCIYTL